MANPPPTPTTNLSSSRILLIDDDEGLLRLMHRRLHREGLLADTALSGSQALAYLQKNPSAPTCLLLDLKLSDMHAGELLDHLASSNLFIPFIIATGQGDESVAVEMMKRGALDYLVKDTNFLELLPTVVQRTLQQLEQEKRLHTTEAALSRSEQRYQTLVHSAPVGIFETDPQGRCLFVNPRWIELTGTQPQNIQGQIWLQSIYPDDHLRVLSNWNATSRLGDEFHDEYRLHLPPNQIRWVIANAVPLHNSQSHLIGFIGTLRDITQRKHAELALRDSEQRFRRMADAAPVLIWTTDPLGQWDYVNQPWLDFTGHPLSHQLGQGWLQDIHPEDQARCLNQFHSALTHQIEIKLEFRLQRHDHSYRWILVHALPRTNESNTFLGYIGSGVDITERRKLEREILEISDQEQQRIGHDLHDGLGQQLTAMELFSYSLITDLEKEGSSQVTPMKQLAQHLRQTITQTRLLSHGLSPVSLEADGLMNALHELALGTAALAKINCQFTCNTPVTPSHRTNALHLYRIAQEAVNNALRHGQARNIQIQLKKTSRQLHLTIKDDGQGFSPHLQTSDGMGLRIMHYRAEMIGATLKIKSKPHQGTHITCTLKKEL